MNWKKETQEKRLIWPYNFGEGFIEVRMSCSLYFNEVELFSFQVDNHSGARSVDIFKREENWDKIKIKSSLNIEDFNSKITSLLPVKYKEKILFGLRMMNEKTRTRKCFTALSENGKAQIEFEINRSEVFKNISLLPELILIDMIEPSEDYASKVGSVIATGEIIYLYPDEPDLGPGSGINCEWRSFPDHIKDALYFCDVSFLNSNKPAIYINNRHPGLKSIFDYKSNRGKRAKVRDAIFSHIATDIWIDFASFAALNLDSSEESIKEFAENVYRTLERRIGISKDGLDGINDSVENRIEIKKSVQHNLQVALKEENKLKTIKLMDDEITNS